MSSTSTLVIGGTGATGHFIVSELHRRGHTVVILHRGDHEIPETPADIEHIHTDPYNPEVLQEALGNRTFDICIAAYGRLRNIAEIMKGRVGQFISIGGQPAYLGYMNPGLFSPAGLPVPTAEDAPLVSEKGQDEKGYRIVQTERSVFAHHPGAVHFRYPYVYGPYQPVPREWCIVRRIMDKRPFIILPEDGLTLHSFGYAENLAHAVLLAVEKPGIAAGQIYNCADATALSLRQVTEIIAQALEHQWEILSMPWPLAAPARPLVMQPLTTHRLMDIGKLQRELGYRDKVPPAEALARTARWLAEHPPSPNGMEEMVLQDPFDYKAEEQLAKAWKQALAAMPPVEFRTEPGFTLSYSGPGGRPRMHKNYDD